MSLTLSTEYTDVAVGELRAKKRWLTGLNAAFDVDKGAQGGSVVFRMWDALTTATQAAGTRLAEGFNNIVVTGTGSTETVTKEALQHQRKSYENTVGLVKTGAKKAVDALLRKVQNVTIATLKATSISQSLAFPTGYIDGLLPSAATTPDMINGVLSVFERNISYLRSVCEAESNEEYFIVMNPTLHGRLSSLRKYGLPLNQEQNRYYIDDIPVYSLTGATNFSGASNECAFFGHNSGFGLKFDDPFVGGEGSGDWQYDPYDGMWKWTTFLPYYYGAVNSALLAEAVNPSS